MGVLLAHGFALKPARGFGFMILICGGPAIWHVVSNVGLWYI